MQRSALILSMKICGIIIKEIKYITAIHEKYSILNSVWAFNLKEAQMH